MGACSTFDTPLTPGVDGLRCPGGRPRLSAQGAGKTPGVGDSPDISHWYCGWTKSRSSRFERVPDSCSVV